MTDKVRLVLTFVKEIDPNEPIVEIPIRRFMVTISSDRTVYQDTIEKLASLGGSVKHTPAYGRYVAREIKFSLSMKDDLQATVDAALRAMSAIMVEYAR